MPETMVRVQFDPVQRRAELVSRLIELRSLIPQFEEEKARIEGMVTLLDEITQTAGPIPVPPVSEDGAKG